MRLAVLLPVIASCGMPLIGVAQDSTWAIESVTVIDVTAASASQARLDNRTVVVRGNRIVQVGAAGTFPIPREARRIDGRGKFLLPGFWDMHVHFNRDDLTLTEMVGPLMLAHGITSVRDLQGDCWEPCPPGRKTIREMRAVQGRVERGEIPVPRIQALSGAIVHGPVGAFGYPDSFPPFWQPRTAEQGREVARYLKERGADFIKPYNTVPRDAYFAMLDEAAKLDLPASGHLAWSVSPIEAARAGVRTIEHARWPVLACNPEYESFRGMFAAFADQEAGFDETVFARFRDAAVVRFDESLCQEIFRALVANDVYLVPTHLTREMDARAADSTYRADPRRKYVTPARLRGWDNDLTNTANGPPELQAFYRGVFDLGLRVTGMAHAAGVKIMVGTDVFDTMVFPGFSYHDELLHLSRAGLSPLAVLRAAAYQGAEFLGKTADFGSVASGKMADLVLLDADPLVDIRHTARIHGVFFNGKMLDRATLDRLIAGAMAAVARLQ